MSLPSFPFLQISLSTVLVVNATVTGALPAGGVQVSLRQLTAGMHPLAAASLRV